MEHVFYLLVSFFLAFEILSLFAVKKIHASVNKYRDLSNVQDMSATFATYYVVNVLYFLTCVIGLISSQWACFLLILALCFIPKRYLTWRIIDGVISILILLFVILNKYHFHIDFDLLTIKLIVG
jgi:uncharacterized membrane protein|nr:MAG: hypothetical protein [Bacteriophage sp.]UWG23435.1 MAG: hypothetical protein [Bacteriophage sp.]DAE85835.1 MAG TPA: hypothetical protein [Bacteriophage sp.]